MDLFAGDISAGPLVTSLLVSTIGFAIFVYGKKATRLPQLVVGLTMMIYPYFVVSVGWSLGLFGALVAALWMLVRAGV